MLLISIVILTRDRCEELRRAIDSCLNNRIEDMEIIVIDNASSDGTRDMIEKLFIESITGIPLKYNYQNINTGVAGGRNIGFSMAKGKYIFLLDDDAWINTENFFMRLIEVMEKEIDVAAISTAVFDVKSKQYQVCTCISEKLNTRGLPEIFYFTGGSTILRKKVFGNCLYLDTLFYGSEEVYASLSIHEEKMKILYDKSLLVIHEPSNNTRFTSSDNTFNNIFNLFLIKKIRYPGVGKILPYLGLILRLKKYLSQEKGLIKKCTNTYKQRYKEGQDAHISIRTVVIMFNKFGIKALL